MTTKTSLLSALLQAHGTFAVFTADPFGSHENILEPKGKLSSLSVELRTPKGRFVNPNYELAVENVTCNGDVYYYPTTEGKQNFEQDEKNAFDLNVKHKLARQKKTTTKWITEIDTQSFAVLATIVTTSEPATRHLSFWCCGNQKCFSTPKPKYLGSAQFKSNWIKKWTEAAGPPSVLSLPIKVYLDREWMKMEKAKGNGFELAEEVLEKVKKWFMHSTLQTKFEISYVLGEVNETMTLPTVQVEKAEACMSIEPFLQFYKLKPKSSEALTIFLGAPSKNLILGISLCGSVCGMPEKRDHNIDRGFALASWRNNVETTAKVVAHEIGHALGFKHDDEMKRWGELPEYRCDDNGVMMGVLVEELVTKWSACSNHDFKEFYRLQTQGGTAFCLTEAPKNSSVLKQKLTQISLAPNLE